MILRWKLLYIGIHIRYSAGVKSECLAFVLVKLGDGVVLMHYIMHRRLLKFEYS